MFVFMLCALFMCWSLCGQEQVPTQADTQTSLPTQDNAGEIKKTEESKAKTLEEEDLEEDQDMQDDEDGQEQETLEVSEEEVPAAAEEPQAEQPEEVIPVVVVQEDAQSQGPAAEPKEAKEQEAPEKAQQEEKEEVVVTVLEPQVKLKDIQVEGVPVQAPEKPAPFDLTQLATPPEEIDEEQELEGIDTVSLDEPEGNWLFKRIWWEKSKDIFGKMRERVDRVVESRMHFFNERSRLDRQFLDPFFVRIGFGQGELTESVNHVLEHLRQAREKDGTLTGQELDYFNLLTEEKLTIEGLSQASQSVAQLNRDMDSALNKLMEQINLARSYEKQAWQLLNEIAEELNDKKAREHYYEIAALWRNIKEIADYIQGPYAQHFMQLASLIMQKTSEIDQALETLQERGIDLKQKVEEAVSEVEVEEDIDEYEEPEDETGWFGSIWNWITSLFAW